MAALERVEDGLRLRLGPGEVEVVTSLCDGLAVRIEDREGADLDDVVLGRLAPTVSRSDPEVDRELRAMLREDLLGTRADRLRQLAGDLRTWSARDDGIDRVLDREAAMRLVEVLNDLRLALAATIAYDETLRETLDPDDRRVDAVRLLDALAWLQGGLIEFIETD
jgi:hypothetical protein